MKRFILSCIILIISMGCGYARMSKVEFDNEGDVVGKSEIKYMVIGSRKLEGVNIDIAKGRANIGKQSADAGQLGAAMKDIAKIAAGATGGAFIPK